MNSTGTTLMGAPACNNSSGSAAMYSRASKNCIVKASLGKMSQIQPEISCGHFCTKMIFVRVSINLLLWCYLVPVMWKSKGRSLSDFSVSCKNGRKYKSQDIGSTDQRCFRGVAVITCASHAQGPRFDPGQKHSFFFSFNDLLLHD